MSSANVSSTPITVPTAPSMTFLMIGTVLASFLIPLAIAMLVFSTPTSRRQPVFILNLFAILLGVALGFWNGYLEIHNILSPSEPISTAGFMVCSAMNLMMPLIVESILLLRVYAILPYRLTPWYQYVGVLAFPIAAKIARLCIVGVFFQRWVTRYPRNGNALQSAQAIFEDTNYVKGYWFLQFFDDAYVSLIFLWYMRRMNSKSVSSGVYRSQSLRLRLQGLLYIALTSYVFPAMCSIVELVLIFLPTQFMPYIYILLVDDYISIIGVVFATVWTTGVSWHATPDATVSGRTTTFGMSSPRSPDSTIAIARHISQREEAKSNDESTYPIRAKVEETGFLSRSCAISV